VQNVFTNMAALVGALACVAVLFLGPAAYLIWTSVRSKRKVEESQSWPSTQGTVLSADIVRRASTDADGDTTFHHEMVVKYEYAVGGQTYTSDRLTLSKVTKSVNPRKEDELLAPYPVGGPVIVYYNPENPADAALTREAPHTKTLMIIGIVLIVVFVCGACPLTYFLGTSLIHSLSGS
jgi:hypothetical protein